MPPFLNPYKVLNLDHGTYWPWVEKMPNNHHWLVVYLPLWKIWKSDGIIILNRWKNKKCSKPPTSNIFVFLGCFSLLAISQWGRPVSSYGLSSALFFISGCQPDQKIIELDDGKMYRKTLYLMVKTMVSCRFSLQPIHWENSWTPAAQDFPQLGNSRQPGQASLESPAWRPRSPGIMAGCEIQPTKSIDSEV